MREMKSQKRMHATIMLRPMASFCQREKWLRFDFLCSVCAYPSAICGGRYPGLKNMAVLQRLLFPISFDMYILSSRRRPRLHIHSLPYDVETSMG
jgi:hypothetical protein